MNFPYEYLNFMRDLKKIFPLFSPGKETNSVFTNFQLFRHPCIGHARIFKKETRDFKSNDRHSNR